MLYSTIVDKNEEGLQMIIEAAWKFEQNKYMDAIIDCRFTKDKILGVTEYVREHKSKLRREHIALFTFALTFNEQYATDNNQCYDSAEKLFSKIRSTISGSKKIYRKFCRTNRKQVQQRPSVFKCSGLVNNHYYDQLFGIETYDECVRTLYAELEEFFMELLDSLILCRKIIMEESNIRKSPERCIRIYERCYYEMLNNSRMIVRDFKKYKIVPDSEMKESKNESGSMHEFICDNYHKRTTSEWQMYVIKNELNKGDDMNDVEKILFGAENSELARKARIALRHFDELEENAHRGKHKDKHSAYCVASFMLWCGIGRGMDGKVKLFVEDYFNTTYMGKYPPVKTNSVNNAKNILLHKPAGSSIDNGTFHGEIEEIIEKYTPKTESSMPCAANF